MSNFTAFFNTRKITRIGQMCMALVCWMAGSLFLASHSHAEAAFGYELQTDVIYGQAAIAPDGDVVQRDLKMDVYSPSDKGDGTAKPAVILVHGGAYHRGGRRQPPYKEAGAVHSRMEDYARLLAPLGYVSFVVEYRLAPELPQPDMTPDAPNLLPVDEIVSPSGLARTNFARRAMGLVELNESEKIILWNAAMASAEDVKMAVEFIAANADAFGIDPKRIAVGGHSAGGGSTLNVSHGLKTPVAAIFPLSPPEMMFELDKAITSADQPPTLLIVSQNDDPAISLGTPALLKQLRSTGVPNEFAWVPGFGHFYPSGAVSLGADGTRMSVGERITQFLDTHLKD